MTPSPPTVLVRATRRGQFTHRAYDDQGKLVHSCPSIIEAGSVFACPVADLALIEDHGDHYHGGSGWMELMDPVEVLTALLPEDERALWHERRVAAADIATTAPALKAAHHRHEAQKAASTSRAITELQTTLTQAQTRHAAAHKALQDLRAARNPPPLTVLKEQTMETPNATA